MSLLVGLPLTLFRLLGSFLLLALRFAVPILLIAAVLKNLVARRLKKTSARYRDEDRQEPKFHGPVYTVDYKDVDDEDEKDK